MLPVSTNIICCLFYYHISPCWEIHLFVVIIFISDGQTQHSYSDLLVAELWGSCGFEILLHLTKWFCSLFLYWLIIMECIPWCLSMLWDNMRKILASLNYLGEVMSRIQFQFQSPEWRAYYTGRGDAINLLGETFHYTSSWHDSVKTHSAFIYALEPSGTSHQTWVCGA